MIFSDPKTHLVYSSEGYWLPPICIKQHEVFEDNHRFLLVEGPVMTGKTIAIEHKVLRHAFDNPGARVGIFAKTTKTGKCVKHDTLIQTTGGLKRANRVSGRDGVIGLNHDTNSPLQSSIKSIWKEPSEAAMILTTDKGYEVTGSPNHPVWCYASGTFQYLTLSDIKAKSDVWVPVFSGGAFPAEHVQVSIATRRRPDVITINDDIAYLLGALTGDGSLSEATLSKHAIGFTGAKPTIVERLQGIVEKHFQDGKMRFEHGIQWRIPSIKLKRLITKLGMCKLSYQKAIPDEIVESPRSVVKSYLQGLFDTDGTADRRGYVSFCSTSYALARDVQALLLAFGIFSDLRVKKTYRRDAWILGICGSSGAFYDEIGFTVPEKQSRRRFLGPEKTGGIKYPDGIVNRIVAIYKSRRQREYNTNKWPYALRKHMQHIGSGHPPGAIGLKKFMAVMNAEDDPILSAFYCSGLATWCRVRSVKDTSAHLYDMEAPETRNYFGNGFVNHNSGGPWQHMTEVLIPIWEKGGFGFRVTQRPKVTGDTRQNMFIIQSRFGPPSEVLLHSLEYAPEAEEKLKSTSYSMLWFSEMDQIAPKSGPPPERDDREVFATAQARLRMEHLPYEAHQIIMDCNPPEDGDEHWLHDIFFKELEQENHPDPEYQKQIGRIHFNIDDNPFLDPRQIANIKNQFKFRQSLYDRFYLGLWKQDNQGGHFHEMFKPEIHVLPNDPAERSNGHVIVPTPAFRMTPSGPVKDMLSGLDLGDKNFAFVIGEKIETNEDNKPTAKFAIIDELTVVNKEIPLSHFVEGMMELVLKWEKFIKEKHGESIKVQWRHWSDEAAWRFRSAAEAMDYLLVRNYSGGKISLKPAPKYHGSIRDRVQLLQQLLFEDRIFFSHQLDECLTMVKVLRKGHTAAEYAAPKRRTHIFDALTYMLQSEAPVDEASYSDVVTDRAPGRLIVCA